MKTKEEYLGLRAALRNIVKDVNQLSKEGKIQVDDTTNVKLEFFGDYKFVLLVMGMKSAKCDHACIYCLASILQRCNVGLPPSFFQTPAMKRKLSDHWHSDPGCVHMPLFCIPLDHVIIDELHLMLRITDRLEKGLIMSAVYYDEKANMGLPASQPNLQMLTKFRNQYEVVV